MHITEEVTTIGITIIVEDNQPATKPSFMLEYLIGMIVGLLLNPWLLVANLKVCRGVILRYKCAGTVGKLSFSIR